MAVPDVGLQSGLDSYLKTLIMCPVYNTGCAGHHFLIKGSIFFLESLPKLWFFLGLCFSLISFLFLPSF